jgi:peptide deformylase
MPLEIAQLGQPVLRQIAAEVPIEQIADPRFQAFLQAMLETLFEAKGAGLAAPQVSVSQRVFLGAILPPDDDEGPPGIEAFINPKITPLSDDKVRGWEGCLSFPELLVYVPRFRAVRIDYVNLDGQPDAMELEDFAARIVQHELDHLDGVLILDRAESTRHIVKASEIEIARQTIADDED